MYQQQQQQHRASMVSDQDIAKGVEAVLRQSDPNAVTTLNSVVHQLESRLGLDLSHKAAFIRDQITLLLRAHPQPQPQNLTTADKDHFALHQPPHFPSTLPQHFPSHLTLHNQHLLHHPHQDFNFRQLHQPPPPLPQQQQLHLPVSKVELIPQNAAVASLAPQMPKESAPAGTKRRGGAGGLNKVCGVSPELQAVVGEPALPRTEIVKQLWAYIRKNNLQDPSNKRKIICDDTLRLVFETDCTDMFKMNKLLSKHIIRLEPTKLPDQAKRQKVDTVDAEGHTTIDGLESTSESDELGQSPVIISEALAKFLGVEGREMTQSKAVKGVWEYIKINHLEDPRNSIVILCDANLRELLGCESISALGITEMLSSYHLFKQS